MAAAAAGTIRDFDAGLGAGRDMKTEHTPKPGEWVSWMVGELVGYLVH
jgi:hypothetical protein